MIRPPSNQHPYDEFWSGDPAFVQPPEPPREGASEAEIKQYESDLKEHDRKLQFAADTGDWSGLRLEGGPLPTRFLVKPMSGHAFRAIVVKLMDGHLNIVGTAPAVAFRVCIKKIENGGYDKEIKPQHSDDYGAIAPIAVTDYLDGISPKIVSEIGARLYRKGTQGLGPKS